MEAPDQEATEKALTAVLVNKYWGLTLEEFRTQYGSDATIDQQGAITAVDRNHEVPHGYIVHPHGHTPDTN